MRNTYVYVNVCVTLVGVQMCVRVMGVRVRFLQNHSILEKNGGVEVFFFFRTRGVTIVARLSQDILQKFWFG